MATETKTIEALLQEKRSFPPPKKFGENAHVKSESIYKKAQRNIAAFWGGFAKELSWYKKWKDYAKASLRHSRWKSSWRYNNTC